VTLTSNSQYQVGTFFKTVFCSLAPVYLIKIFVFIDTAFVPAPKVNAAVVKLVPLKTPRLKCEFNLVSKVVRYLFQFKNKKWPIGI
jgi:16S rRNA A1518/A1519 N6-dimethyltransferase RsmA/KsgA/DIM1 with predicted DNA glycosylase/AP lyase activity